MQFHSLVTDHTGEHCFINPLLDGARVLTETEAREFMAETFRQYLSILGHFKALEFGVKMEGVAGNIFFLQQS